MKTSVILRNNRKLTLDKYLALFLFITIELVLISVLFFPRALKKIFKFEVMDIFIDYGTFLTFLFIINTLFLALFCINYFNNSLSRWQEHNINISDLKYHIKNLTSFEKQILREFYLIDESSVIEVPRNVYVINNLVDKLILEFANQSNRDSSSYLVKLTNHAFKYIKLSDLDWPEARGKKLNERQKAWLRHNRPNWVGSGSF